MDYVVAGYAFAFGGLALYALSIWWRFDVPDADAFDSHSRPRPALEAPRPSAHYRGVGRACTRGAGACSARGLLALLELLRDRSIKP